jgi:hypothetical protein
LAAAAYFCILLESGEETIDPFSEPRKHRFTCAMEQESYVEIDAQGRGIFDTRT